MSPSSVTVSSGFVAVWESIQWVQILWEIAAVDDVVGWMVVVEEFGAVIGLDVEVPAKAHSSRVRGFPGGCGLGLSVWSFLLMVGVGDVLFLGEKKMMD